MYSVETRNISEAIPFVVNILRHNGVPTSSRNGPVTALQEPFSLTLHRPWERVVVWPGRKDNPFLNFFDGLFALSRINDAKFMIQFSKRFADYAVDGKFHGHYGTRLRWYGQYGDQLETAIQLLIDNPYDRRVVLALWDPEIDFDPAFDNPDVPCNVMVLPRVIDDGQLTLTVINRSNDIAWGLLNVNHVQFSFLLEYMAGRLGRPMGPLTIITNNLHGYEEFGPWRWMKTADPPKPIYPCPSTPIYSHGLLQDIDDLVQGKPLSSEAISPMWDAWQTKTINARLSPDWRQAIELYFKEEEK